VITPQPPSQVRSLRRDAAENRDRILDAARALFDEDGLDVGMDAIAERAGVGVGTVYRRFSSKEELIEAVVGELPSAIRDVILDALAHESIAEGWASFLDQMGALQVAHVGCLPRLWNAADEEVRLEVTELGRTLLVAAQEAGVVRADIVYEDVSMLLWSMQAIIERTLPIEPDAWRRHLELFSQALAPGGAPLSARALTPDEVAAASRAAAR
jgi:AcrR family transcriptional regulator